MNLLHRDERDRNDLVALDLLQRRGQILGILHRKPELPFRVLVGVHPDRDHICKGLGRTDIIRNLVGLVSGGLALHPILVEGIGGDPPGHT